MPRRRRNASGGGTKRKNPKLESPPSDASVEDKHQKVITKSSTSSSSHGLEAGKADDSHGDPPIKESQESASHSISPNDEALDFSKCAMSSIDQTEDEASISSPSGMVSVTLEVNEEGEVTIGNQGKENDFSSYEIKVEEVDCGTHILDEEADPLSGCPDHPKLTPLNPEFVSELERSLNSGVPSDWFCKAYDGGLNVMLLSRCKEKAIQRRVCFPFSGGVEISVHRKQLLSIDVQEHLEGLLPIVPITFVNCPEFIDHALKVVARVWSLEVCGGADVNDLKDQWAYEKGGMIDFNPYGEIRYAMAFRSVQCKLLVKSSNWRCKECMKLYTSLHRRQVLKFQKQLSIATGISSATSNLGSAPTVSENSKPNTGIVYILPRRDIPQNLSLSAISDKVYSLRDGEYSKLPLSSGPQVPVKEFSKLPSSSGPQLPVKEYSKLPSSSGPQLPVKEKTLQTVPRLEYVNLMDMRPNYSGITVSIEEVSKRNIALELKNFGVTVNEALASDFTEILKGCVLSDIQKLFLEMQIELGNMKKPCEIKWHPTLIRLALMTRTTSNTAATGVITLPSGKVLFNFSQVLFRIKDVQKADFEQLHTKYLEKPSDRSDIYHVLLLDEIDVHNNLVYQKSNGELIGFVKLSDVKTEVEQLEAFILQKRNITRPKHYILLVYMVKSITCGLKEVVGLLDRDMLSREMLYDTTWDIIKSLEENKIKIIGVVLNGSSKLKEFMSLHTPEKKLESGQVYCTVNLKVPNEERLLFFFIDAAYLLKEIRNCFELSGSTGAANSPNPSRMLTRNKENIDWKTIVKLYLHYKWPSSQIDSQTVFLTDYSRQRASLAAAVFSDAVAKDLQSRFWPYTVETVIFITKVHNFFKCFLDVDVAEGNESAEPLPPYTSIEDPRFAKMLEFIDYLSSWKAEMEERIDLPPSERSRLFLDTEIVDDLEVSFRAFMDVLSFLWSKGTKEVTPNSFWLEPLGKYLKHGWFGFLQIPNYRIS